MGQHRRKPDCQRDLYADRNDDDQRIVDQRLRERSIAKQNLKILEPDKFARRAIAVPAVEAVPGRLPHRQDHEEGEQQQRRGQENQQSQCAVMRNGALLPLRFYDRACQRRRRVHGNIGHLIRFRIHAMAMGAAPGGTHRSGGISEARKHPGSAARPLQASFDRRRFRRRCR